MSDDDTGKPEDPALMEQCEAAAYRAERVHEWLDPLLEKSALKDAADRPYTFKGRTKSANDIYLKVLGRRKNPKTSKYGPNDVTDASGFRIIKLFNDEVPQAVDELLSFLNLLKETTNAADSDEKLLEITEVEFHTSRLNDPLSIFNEVKTRVAKHGRDLKPPKKGADGQPIASSYSSVHVLVKSSVKKGGTAHVASSEIQVRSVFEEAWSEISHRLKYAREKTERATGATAVADKAQLDNAFLHLDALKSLTDGCAQYADLVNKQIKISIEPRADRSGAQPLDPPDAHSADKFARYGAAMRTAVKRAYDQRSRAVAQKKAGARAANFRAAAALFQKAMAGFKTSRNTEDERLFDVLREELAFCWMFSDNEELTSKAEDIYRDLWKKRPERVSVLLRLGQLRRDAGDFVEARTLMEAGLEVAEKSPDPNPSVRRRASWVLRRDLAFILWRLVDSSAEPVALLRRAIALSEEALQYAEAEPDIVNTRQNHLYYVIDLWNRSPAAQKKPLADAGKKLLDELRPKLDLKKWSLETLDTIARGETAFGDHDRAATAAVVVARKIGERMAAIMREHRCSAGAAFERMTLDERNMYARARAILETLKAKRGRRNSRDTSRPKRPRSAAGKGPPAKPRR